MIRKEDISLDQTLPERYNFDMFIAS